MQEEERTLQYRARREQEMKEKEEKQKEKEKEKQKVPASPVARSQVSPSPRNSSRVKQAEPFRAIGKTAPSHLFGAHAGAKTMALKDKVIANMMQEEAWQLIKEGKNTEYDAYTKGMRIPDKHVQARARAPLLTKTRKTGQERKGSASSKTVKGLPKTKTAAIRLSDPGFKWRYHDGAPERIYT